MMRLGITVPQPVLGPNIRIALQHDSGALVTMVSNHRLGIDFGIVEGDRTIDIALTDNPLATRSLSRPHRRLRLHRIPTHRLLERRRRVRGAQSVGRDRPGIRAASRPSSDSPEVGRMVATRIPSSGRSDAPVASSAGSSARSTIATSARSTRPGWRRRPLMPTGTTSYPTTISVIVPVYDPPVHFLVYCLALGGRAAGTQLAAGGRRRRVDEVGGRRLPRCLRGAARGDERVIVLRKENGGISSALNAALATCDR